MAAPGRVQALIYALGSAKQADIATASTSYIRVPKLDLGVPFLDYGTETDKEWIGKGNEFISAAGVYPTAYSFNGSINRYGSAEFMAWAWIYALSKVTLASSLYTAIPLDNSLGLEPLYFSIVAQLSGGGGTIFDEKYIGCAIEEVTTEFKYGPTLASIQQNCTYVGSGKNLIPSGVTVPATLTEKYMHSSSMAITVNGVDYVSTKTMLMGSIGWKNNILVDMGYYPGSGSQDGASIMGRMLIGSRMPSFQFTALLQSDSTEYAALIAQTTGTAVVTFTFDATHFCTFTFESVSFESVRRTQENGLVAVTVVVAPKATGGSPDVLTFTSKNGVADLGQ